MMFWILAQTYHHSIKSIPFPTITIPSKNRSCRRPPDESERGAAREPLRPTPLQVQVLRQRPSTPAPHLASPWSCSASRALRISLNPPLQEPSWTAAALILQLFQIQIQRQRKDLTSNVTVLPVL